MIGVGSVRGLTVMIATEGIFVWCAVTPTKNYKVLISVEEKEKKRRRIKKKRGFLEVAKSDLTKSIMAL
jgi:hypothetical protein